LNRVSGQSDVLPCAELNPFPYDLPQFSIDFNESAHSRLYPTYTRFPINLHYRYELIHGFKGLELDFGMQILLAHALKSEAGTIRQYYPQAKTLTRGSGQELILLEKNLHLLRTGLGLDLCKMAMLTHVDPDKFDLIIHFGVSGSLSEDIPLLQIIQGTTFSCAGKPDLEIAPPEMFGDMSIPKVAFYSSLKAITDETTRESTRAGGAEAVDMESYSVARFCRARELPLLAIRCISDRAGASTPEDFKQNYFQATQTLQKFLLKNILTRLP